MARHPAVNAVSSGFRGEDWVAPARRRGGDNRFASGHPPWYRPCRSHLLWAYGIVRHGSRRPCDGRSCLCECPCVHVCGQGGSPRGAFLGAVHRAWFRRVACLRACVRRARPGAQMVRVARSVLHCRRGERERTPLFLAPRSRHVLSCVGRGRCRVLPVVPRQIRVDGRCCAESRPGRAWLRSPVLLLDGVDS